MVVIKTILASVEATPSKQLSKPLNVTRFNPSKVALCKEVSSRDANAASISSKRIIDCSGATLKKNRIN